MATCLYQKRRKKCHKHYVLDNPDLYNTVKRLFLEEQWSPEEISYRLRLENYPFNISCNTIYRAIYARKFDEKGLPYGNRGCIRKLRHKGKTRKKKTLTPDRGKEFACHEEVTKETGIEFYFPPPHSPWDRGTNENTNGLLREYIPKSTDIDSLSQKDIAIFFDKLNKRPRKCLGWKTPFEVFYGKVLHLV